jgi:hypothetical protein
MIKHSKAMKKKSMYIIDKRYCISIIDKMTKVEENGIPSSLHYALTDSQCNKCGVQLEWKAEFNDINSPKYIAKHCNDDYIITVDTVKVEMIRQQAVEERGNRSDQSPTNTGEENERQKKQHQLDQPKAFTMAELLKDKESMLKKTKLGDGSNIKAEDR